MHGQTGADDGCAGGGQAERVQPGQQPLTLGVVRQREPLYVVDLARQRAAPLGQFGGGGFASPARCAPAAAGRCARRVRPNGPARPRRRTPWRPASPPGPARASRRRGPARCCGVALLARRCGRRGVAGIQMFGQQRAQQRRHRDELLAAPRRGRCARRWGHSRRASGPVQPCSPAFGSVGRVACCATLGIRRITRTICTAYSTNDHR